MPRARTNRGPRVQPNWHDQNHIDLGAQDQRISNLENVIGDIGDQLREIGRRLESKPTDVWKIIGGVVTVISLIGGFLLIGKQPYDEGLVRHENAITRLFETAVSKEDFKSEIDLVQRRSLEGDAERQKLRDGLEAARIALARLEGSTNERHEEYLREHTANMARVDAIDGNLIKRPEIEAALASLREMINLTNGGMNDRVTSVIQSLNEVRHDLISSFSIGDEVKDLETQIREIRLGVPTPALPAGKKE